MVIVFNDATMLQSRHFLRCFRNRWPLYRDGWRLTAVSRGSCVNGMTRTDKSGTLDSGTHESGSLEE